MVWYSTKQSLENKEISFLAIIEVVIAVTLYWWVAVYFDTYLHLMISVFVAPFLLLRSKASISKGLLLLEKGVYSKRNYIPIFRYLIEIMIYIAVFLVSSYIFENYVDIDNVFFTIFILFSCSGIGLGIGLGLFGTAHNQRVGMLSIAIVLYTSIYIEGFEIIYYIFSVIAILFIAFILFQKIGTEILGGAPAALLGTGVACGFIMIVFVYKIIAILQYFPNGISNIIENWKYNNFTIDIRSKPEIIFGIEKYDGLNEYKLSKFIDSRKNSDIVESFGISAMYMILYFFAVLYRWSIKGTFWFYIPLLILVKSPNNIQDNVEIKDFLSKLHRYAYVKFFFLISLIILTLFFIKYIDPNFINERSEPFSSIILLLYFDFDSIELWKFLQILIAFLTFVLYFWSDYLWKKGENRQMRFENNKQVKYIFFTNNIRNTISFFYFSFLFCFIAYRFNIWEYKFIPQFIEGYLKQIIQIIQYKF